MQWGADEGGGEEGREGRERRGMKAGGAQGPSPSRTPGFLKQTSGLCAQARACNIGACGSSAARSITSSTACFTAQQEKAGRAHTCVNTRSTSQGWPAHSIRPPASPRLPH
eukprot:362112-Chlamydomonas_euryale.AAC.1